MKGCFGILVFLLLVFSSGTVISQEVPFPDFLAGLWQVEGRQTFEDWEIVDSGHLKGIGYELKNGMRKDLEILALGYKAGVLTYTAIVAGQNEGKAIDFPLASYHDRTYIFENPDHDFPQKISYRLAALDTLKVRVSGGREGFTLTLVRNK